ncbi:hypothetical protein GCM10010282_30720 [Streptomyces roseolus]|nr:hypothetical protein GCM10010282_30720 [Streptomyces roseolus]
MVWAAAGAIGASCPFTVIRASVTTFPRFGAGSYGRDEDWDRGRKRNGGWNGSPCQAFCIGARGENRPGARASDAHTTTHGRSRHLRGKKENGGATTGPPEKRPLQQPCATRPGTQAAR